MKTVLQSVIGFQLNVILKAGFTCARNEVDEGERDNSVMSDSDERLSRVLVIVIPGVG